MKSHLSRSNPYLITTEKNSIKLLMEKMIISRKEIHEISGRYGVTAAKMIELMQLSKYEFVNKVKSPWLCKTCNETRMGKIIVSKFA
jgi:hypothetical protein